MIDHLPKAPAANPGYGHQVRGSRKGLGGDPPNGPYRQGIRNRVRAATVECGAAAAERESPPAAGATQDMTAKDPTDVR